MIITIEKATGGWIVRLENNPPDLVMHNDGTRKLFIADEKLGNWTIELSRGFPVEKADP